MAGQLVPRLDFDAAFPRLKALVIERTGHFYYADKDDLLWERIRKRLRATGCRDGAHYLERLADPVLGPTEWARLEADITIGETFFFRYAEQFTALRERILPDIIERRRAEKRLRIWSAGCATGAEPYSIAILLKQLLGDDLENWRIAIVGSDINETFLETARQALFGRWVLRSLSPEDLATFFDRTDGKDRWLLKKEYRALVRFERHNLLSLLDGTSPLQFTEFDLVLCRNVLIYFHPDTVVRIVKALSEILREEGWMLLGHAEPSPAFAALLKVINLPGTVAYRRLSAEDALSEPPPIETLSLPANLKPALPAPRPALPQPAKPLPIRPARPAPPAAKQMPVAVPHCPDSLLAEVRALADAGRFRDAEALCRRALSAQPLSPALHFYEGMIAQALKKPAEAEKAFRRSIYLDKSFAMAHYHLGLLLLADGRQGAGRRALTNAGRIAAALPGETVLEETDGLTAQEMRNLIRLHLRVGSRPGKGE